MLIGEIEQRAGDVLGVATDLEDALAEVISNHGATGDQLIDVRATLDRLTLKLVAIRAALDPESRAAFDEIEQQVDAGTVTPSGVDPHELRDRLRPR
jgi:hypothetical protein